MPMSSLREAVEMHTSGQSRIFPFGTSPEFNASDPGTTLEDSGVDFSVIKVHQQ